MDVFTFRHIAMEHLGSLADPLALAGLHVHSIDLFGDPSLHIDLRPARGLIFLGGPMSVNDNLDYLRRELGLLEAAIAEGKPVLGICLGAQLVAKALGAAVYRNQVSEIGWAPIRRTEAGHIDPLFAAFADPEIVFHWHGETFDLPAGAIRLASSEHCANQAFRYGSNVYGIQFHVETTPAMIAEWCAAPANAADVARLESPIDPQAHAGRMAGLAAAVAAAWARTVVPSGAANTAG